MSAVVAPAETTSFAVSSLLAPTPFPAAGLLDTRPAGNFAVYLGALRSPEAAAMLLRETGIGAALGGRRRALFGPPRPIDADDVLAWLTTLANISGVDLEHAVREKYLGADGGPKGVK